MIAGRYSRYIYQVNILIMSKSKRLNIFSEIERKELYEIPYFSNEDKIEYFIFTQEELDLITKGADIISNIFCAIQIGYFKITKSFPIKDVTSARKSDLEYIRNKYFFVELMLQKYALKHEERFFD